MKTILLVDDEAVQLETLKRGLKIRGYRVLEAACGKKALSIIEGPEKVDIVITDFAMPEMNGMELLKKIRSVNANLPVIMMTAYSDKDLEVQAIRNECVGFLDKPFELHELMAAIEKNIN